MKNFYSILSSNFPFNPTVKQELFFQKIAAFLESPSNDSIFVLKGYAGTGKTTVISTIVNNLVEINKKYVLLAPTGRAAKVIANYSNKPAFTIHKKIYFPKKYSFWMFFFFFFGVPLFSGHLLIFTVYITYGMWPILSAAVFLLLLLPLL